MGKSLQDLGLKEETLPTAGQDLADLPEFGSFRIPPQPGPFRFKLPDMSSVFETFDSPTLGQRIRVIFDRDHPLLITQSLGNAYNGEPFETRLSNAERARGKDKAVVASDVDYLLRALQVKQKPKSNREYVTTLQQQSNKEFGADLRYSWKCSADRNMRVFKTDPQTGLRAGTEETQQKGCGNSYYQEDVPKGADGLVPYELQCQCGAALRAFANLDNLRA